MTTTLNSPRRGVAAASGSPKKPLIELRMVKLEIDELGYAIGELNQKIKLNPARDDMKSIRAQKIARLKVLQVRRRELVEHIDAQPFSRVDVVDVLEQLTEVESAIAHGGSDNGSRKLRAFIEFLARDVARLDAAA